MQRSSIASMSCAAVAVVTAVTSPSMSSQYYSNEYKDLNFFSGGGKYSVSNSNASIYTDNRQLMDELNRIKGLKSLWSDLGFEFPDELVFAKSEIFIEKLHLNSFTKKINLALSEDGEINFSIKEDGVVLDLGFDETGCYSYYAKNGDNKYFGDDKEVSDQIPDEIIKIITNSVPFVVV